jgi:hypothetical protein
MALANPELIAAIEKTVFKLSNGSSYQWGHMGSCNCGNLAQELTKLERAEIHRYAMERYGDWNEQLVEFCPTSGYPMDLMISKMMEFGLTIEDLAHLERLSDPKILSAMPVDRRNSISKNSKNDVIYYMKTWAGELRKTWLIENRIKDVEIEEKKLTLTTL